MVRGEFDGGDDGIFMRLRRGEEESRPSYVCVLLLIAVIVGVELLGNAIACAASTLHVVAVITAVVLSVVLVGECCGSCCAMFMAVSAARRSYGDVGANEEMLKALKSRSYMRISTGTACSAETQ